jgi:hypothetical protein
MNMRIVISIELRSNLSNSIWNEEFSTLLLFLRYIVLYLYSLLHIF